MRAVPVDWDTLALPGHGEGARPEDDDREPPAKYRTQKRLAEELGVDPKKFRAMVEQLQRGAA